MSPVLYGYPASPPVRGTLMTIEALGLEVEFKEINPLSPDLLKPEFLKLNPLHTIPTYEEDDFAIWNSHVINAYLVGKYGKDDSLYPKDLRKRAVVDQRMYFDDGILFNKLKLVAFPMVSGKSKTADPDGVAELENAYNSLETLLERTTYVAGEHLTIADFSIVTTLTSANILVPIASNRFPKISEWLAKMQALPYYASANQVGLDEFAALIKSKLA